MPDIFMETHREQIILFAARNNVPAIYSQSVFVRDGGLLSYGADRVDIFRRSASYVDRILKGAKPGELPVQPPVKFTLGQYEDRQVARPRDSIVPPATRRRGHGVVASFLCVLLHPL